MANSYVEYPGDGTQREFTVTFPYISRSHVLVTVNDETATFTWVNDSLVRLSAIPGNGTTVRIYRVTPISEGLIDFAHGGRLAEDDLDTMSEQILYLLQEDIENRSETHNHNQLYYTEDEIDALQTLKADLVHTHDDRYFTEAEVTAALAEKAASVHSHNDLYFTEAETTTLLAGKAAAVHNHDTIYYQQISLYTKSEINTLLAGKAALVHNHNGHTHAESEITDLSHDAAYIGGVAVVTTGIADGQILKYNLSASRFEPAADETSETATELSLDLTPQLGGNLDMNGHNIQTVTPTEMAYVHGVTSAIQTQLNGKAASAHTHDDRYFTESEVTTALAGKSDTGHTHAAVSHTGEVTGTTALTIASAVVSQGKLKTSSGSVSGTAQANLTLPGGEYGFYPQVCVAGGGVGNAYIGYQFNSASYITNINLAASAGSTAYAQQRYVTSSGEVFWIFLLRNRSTGLIDAAYQSPDHPCFGNGNDPLITPHPFPDFNPVTHEIIVMNPDYTTVGEMKRLCRPQRQGNRPLDLLELILDEQNRCYEIDENSEQEYSKTPVTVGIIHNMDEKPLWLLDEAPIIHMPIPQPEYVKVKRLVEWTPKTISIVG